MMRDMIIVGENMKIFWVNCADSFSRFSNEEGFRNIEFTRIGGKLKWCWNCTRRSV